MPSTEAQTPFNYGGVGNLPGKRSEQRVALLPEERLHPAGMFYLFTLLAFLYMVLMGFPCRRSYPELASPTEDGSAAYS